MAVTNSMGFEVSVDMLHRTRVRTEFKKKNKNNNTKPPKLGENLGANHPVVQEDWKLWQKAHLGKQKASGSTKRDQGVETRTTKEYEKPWFGTWG